MPTATSRQYTAFFGCGLVKGIRMNTFARIFGLAAIALCAVDAHAELEYSPSQVFDPESGLSWRVFDTLATGQAAGFAAATVDQTAELFLHYAPPDSGGVLPGYHPLSGDDWTVGKVTDYTTSGNGRSYSVSWEGLYLDETGSYRPPSLINLGSNVHWEGVPKAEAGSSLVALALDGVGWSPVLISSTITANQYGLAWGREEGIIDPIPDQFSGCRLSVSEEYGPTCSFILDDSGAFKIGGYLMVSSVPEPSIPASLLVGIAGLVLLGGQRRA
jgi:hypothetical protein